MSKGNKSAAGAGSPAKVNLIAIVDDDPLLRAGYVGMLENAGFHTEDYGSAEEFLATDWAGRVAFLLLDIGLPGIGGLELLKRLGHSGTRLPVVMVTGSGDVESAVQAMKGGAADFIEKPARESDILSAIERAIGQKTGGLALDALQIEAARVIPQLTRRQREILQLILDGHPNKNIAADLAISQRTVENHRAAIMRKSGVKSLPALARLVFAANLAAAPARASPIRAGEGAPQVPSVGATAAGEIESDRFERYFDQIPLAVSISKMAEKEYIVYANPAFEQLSGQSRAEVEGLPWSSLRGVSLDGEASVALGDAVVASSDLVGTFRIDRPDQPDVMVDAFSSVIVDDNDGPTFRLVALVDIGARDIEKLQQLEMIVREKDTRLMEIQHRVKNNLQMITALIRIEARKARGRLEPGPFDRLAGRIDSIQLMYKLLSESGKSDEIDLGVYLSEVASSVMHSSAVEGIRLDLKVDSCPVSVNVALPTGLVVNELLTNAIKHAFVDREGGTITLESLTDAHCCRVVVADDGIGLPTDGSWPRRGKLGALIVQSLRQNAKADISVESKPGKGMRVTIAFSLEIAAALVPSGNVGRDASPGENRAAAQ